MAQVKEVALAEKEGSSTDYADYADFFAKKQANPTSLK